MEVKILNKFEEFTSKLNGNKYGLYEVAVDGNRVGIISRNHNNFTMLTHSMGDKDYLHPITSKFRDALIEILGVSKDKEAE